MLAYLRLEGRRTDVSELESCAPTSQSLQANAPYEDQRTYISKVDRLATKHLYTYISKVNVHTFQEVGALGVHLTGWRADISQVDVSSSLWRTHTLRLQRHIAATASC